MPIIGGNGGTKGSEVQNRVERGKKYADEIKSDFSRWDLF